MGKFICFCMVGLCGFALDVALFTLLVKTGVSGSIALLCSYLSGTMVNFLLCMRYLFVSNRTISALIIRYILVSGVVLGANQLILPITTEWFYAYPAIARTSAAALVAIFQFFLIKSAVFGS